MPAVAAGDRESFRFEAFSGSEIFKSIERLMA
jgi:hypothetical protein